MRLSPLNFLLEWDEFGSDGGGDDWGSSEDLYFDDWGVGSDLDSDSWLSDLDDSWVDDFSFDEELAFPEVEVPTFESDLLPTSTVELVPLVQEYPVFPLAENPVITSSVQELADLAAQANTNGAAVTHISVVDGGAEGNAVQVVFNPIPGQEQNGSVMYEVNPATGETRITTAVPDSEDPESFTITETLSDGKQNVYTGVPKAEVEAEFQPQSKQNTQAQDGSLSYAEDADESGGLIKSNSFEVVGTEDQGDGAQEYEDLSVLSKPVYPVDPLNRTEVDRALEIAGQYRQGRLDYFKETGEVVELANGAPLQNGNMPIKEIHIGSFGASLVKTEIVTVSALAAIAEEEGFKVVYTGNQGDLNRVTQQLSPEGTLSLVRNPTAANSDPWQEDGRSLRGPANITVPVVQNGPVPGGQNLYMQDFMNATLQGRETRLIESGMSPEDAKKYAGTVEFQGQTYLPVGAGGVQASVAAETIGSGKWLDMSYTYIEGGNSLVGQNENGTFAIVGADSVTVSKYLLNKDGVEVENADVTKMMAADLGVNKVIVIEQPGEFHIDMRMNLRPDGTVVMNDAQKAGEFERDLIRDRAGKEGWTDQQLQGALQRSEARQEQQLVFENIVTQQLNDQGVPIQKIPGVLTVEGSRPGDVRQMNFMNLEQGTSLKDGGNFAVMLGGDPKAEEMIRAEYQRLGVDRVHFLPASVSDEYLSRMGGVNCILKSDSTQQFWDSRKDLNRPSQASSNVVSEDDAIPYKRAGGG